MPAGHRIVGEKVDGSTCWFVLILRIVTGGEWVGRSSYIPRMVGRTFWTILMIPGDRS